MMLKDVERDAASLVDSDDLAIDQSPGREKLASIGNLRELSRE